MRRLRSRRSITSSDSGSPKRAHIKLLNVTYRSGPEASLAAAAGDVTLAITSPASLYPSLTKAGTVKVLAITSAEHPSYLPASWQTLAQNGLPIDVTIYLWPVRSGSDAQPRGGPSGSPR